MAAIEPVPSFAALGFEAGVHAQGPYEISYHVRGPQSASPMLLLHGFPQTGMIWRPMIAAMDTLSGGQSRMARRLIVADLPGYGESRTRPGAEPAAKRAWVPAFEGLLGALGAGPVDLAGHDRGGRLAYRMALQAPGLVRRLAVLDILPNEAYWRGLADRTFAQRIYHWTFLAQPHPFPETMIGAAPDFFIDDKLARWSAARDLSAFAPDALESYRRNARDPARLRAMCDDYRAGASLDVDDDLQALRDGVRIAAPTLALWSDAGLASKSADPLATWRAWCADIRGASLRCGHFPPEEAPEETAAVLLDFFS